MLSTGWAKTYKTSLIAAACLWVLTACGTPVLPRTDPTPSSTPDKQSSTSGPTGSPSPAETTQTPTGSSTPTPSESVSVSASPAPTNSEPPLGEGSPTPGPTAAPVTCTAANPIRVEKASSAPRRTTEVVTVVSDGKNLTSGTREQTDFTTPNLEGPDGTAVTDEATIRKVATLIAAGGKNRVLVVRPEGPDANASANRKPFNAPGTYVLFNASAMLTADVIVQCGGQEQRWTFTSESDPTIGQVNCAVEPPKTNALARLLYTNNC